MVGHLRIFCVEPGWPRGELNLPRALVTEKAFPENEAVLTTSDHPEAGRRPSTNEVLYEHRLGKRGQYEVVVPFEMLEADGGQWRRGIGDIAVAYKHVLYASTSSAERS